MYCEQNIVDQYMNNIIRPSLEGLQIKDPSSGWLQIKDPSSGWNALMSPLLEELQRIGHLLGKAFDYGSLFEGHQIMGPHGRT